ncbi:DUF4920 domain-containing protein [Arcticibacterium luteifluviistationis]|uniref:DUF4920 domain-containing protein n=1 Tax=Arcticibacterium luteifluviistationis TaxID=1784714 RepID=A0A2Z4GAY8_9BACT|nr:DUF4920 domain-containing protein [Arcticibacterium luteifluviistationis]AWV98449.1 DUF4920 domain-containing protein [Arcticibacterium luteifluviistationis]
MRKLVLVIAFCSSISVFGQDFKAYGDSFVKTSPTAAKSLKQLDLSDTADLEVEGEVNAVCQAKGCWMTVNLENGETMRVTFKDYGFFVPKNLAGTKVVFKGKPEVTETSVEELRHYAADAGKTKKEIMAITEPEIALTFVADGVLVPGK